MTHLERGWAENLVDNLSYTTYITITSYII